MSNPNRTALKQAQPDMEDADELAGMQMSPLILSARDWEVLVKSLDDTDTLRPKLAAAMKRYLEWKNT